MKSTLTSMIFTGALLLATAASGAFTSTNYTLSSGVLPAGAGRTTSTSYALSSTFGLFSNSMPSSSLAYLQETGFWTPSVLNSAPTISGTPQSPVAAGALYSFVPSASDADNDPLTFSISNIPSWGSFNTSNGALTGTAVAGTYSNIQISVSDWSVTTPLPAFAITVTSPGSGGGTRVPVMEGWWLLPGILTGLGLFARRRKE